ncbi:sulfotransferase [Thermomonospora cellulosilytica]|uniref:Sulfotransferase n=1 Tax=Thermomonospora cellulosilytica TaxID=1411118 RepID=A0A7W3N0I5_9ACTN|nr:sulfotransferase [Thermomonospora cellulosilytica]MBA9005254.1 hypothetical protein [Thermomonospora cellulosilytica]
MTRVVYITGWCRTGSTLLGNLLGEYDGVAHVGELAYLWANGVLRSGTNTLCGCGRDLLECPVWTKVLARLHPGRDDADLRRVATGYEQRHARHLRTRHTRARLAEARGRSRKSPQVARTLSALGDLYAAIGETLSADVVVDSSKFPAEAAALLGMPELDARVLHLVRDPRATAYSWRRAKEYIPAMGVGRSTAYWTGFNLASDWIGAAFPGRYLRIRYEDFAADPAHVLATIAAWAGLEGAPPVSDEATATLGENHTVTGNPDRLRRGPVRIRPDLAWMTGLPKGETMISTALALPLLSRYGYPLTGRR